MMRAAGGGLRLGICPFDAPDQDLIDRYVEEDAQRVQVVDGGKALSGLPFVNRAGFLESESFLQVLDGQSSLFAKADDVLSGCCDVDRRADHDALPGGADRLRARAPACLHL